MDYKHLEVIYHQSPEIAEIIFKNNTRSAVDDYVQAILAYGDYVRAEDKLNQAIHIMIDVSQSGMYPVKYGSSEVAKVLPQLADLPKAYFAYLVDNSQDSFLIEQLRHFPSTRNQDNRKTFKATQRDEAIAWLLSNTDI